MESTPNLFDTAINRVFDPVAQTTRGGFGFRIGAGQRTGRRGIFLGRARVGFFGFFRVLGGRGDNIGGHGAHARQINQVHIDAPEQ